MVLFIHHNLSPYVIVQNYEIYIGLSGRLLMKIDNKKESRFLTL